MGNVHSERKNRWLFPVSLGIVACGVAFAIAFGFIRKKPTIPEQGKSTQGLAPADPTPRKATEPKAEEAEEQMVGIPSGDGCLIYIKRSDHEPDIARFIKINKRMEQMGYVMDFNSLKLSRFDDIYITYRKK
jgi:hypothetical protein